MVKSEFKESKFKEEENPFIHNMRHCTCPVIIN